MALVNVFPGLFGDSAAVSFVAEFEGNEYKVTKTARRCFITGELIPAVVVAGPKPLEYAKAAARHNGREMWKEAELSHNSDGVAIWLDWNREAEA